MAGGQGSGVIAPGDTGDLKGSFGAVLRNPVLAEIPSQSGATVHGFEVFAGKGLCFDSDVLAGVAATLSKALDSAQLAEGALDVFSGVLISEWAELERDAWTRRRALSDAGTLAQDYPTPQQIEWMHSLRRSVSELKNRVGKLSVRAESIREVVRMAIQEYERSDTRVSEVWGNTTLTWSDPFVYQFVPRPGKCGEQLGRGTRFGTALYDSSWRLYQYLFPALESKVNTAVYGALLPFLTDVKRMEWFQPSRKPDFRPAWQTISQVKPQILRTPSDLFASFISLYKGEDKDKIQVTKMTDHDGTVRWVALIPGTQEWGPYGKDSAMHLGSALDTLAGDESDGIRAVDAALKAAGVSPQDPIVLFGHSQGGLIASAIASLPTYQSRYNVKAVVTSESPVPNLKMPSSVTTLNIENNKDGVPKLDGKITRGNGNHVTVRGDVTTPEEGGPHDVEVAADVYAQANQNSMKVQDVSERISSYLWRPGAKVETSLYETPFGEYPQLLRARRPGSN